MSAPHVIIQDPCGSKDSPVKAAIVVISPNVRVICNQMLVTKNVSSVVLLIGHLKIGLINVYLEGSKEVDGYLNEIQDVINNIGTQDIVIAGDVNASSPWWGCDAEDSRGGAVMDLLALNNMNVLNSGATPTFHTFRGGRLFSSIVDVTACSDSLLARISDWGVDTDTAILTDHRTIRFQLSMRCLDPPPRHASTRIYNTTKAKWTTFADTLKMEMARLNLTTNGINDIKDYESLENLVRDYHTAISKACDEAIPRIAHRKSSMPQWWTAELDSQRKSVKTLRRRIHSANTNIRPYCVAEYTKARNEFKKNVELTLTSSWKKFCTKQKEEDAWSCAQRIITRCSNTKRIQSSLLRDPLTGATMTPAKSAEHLADTFFPPDDPDSDSPTHKTIRESVRLAARDLGQPLHSLFDATPSFTHMEIQQVYSGTHPEKAPGADGFTADICCEAYKHDREFQLALYNKCLAIGHFPIEWKRAWIRVIPKPGKSDYMAAKSYRPIGLLPVLGKVLEKLIVNRLTWRMEKEHLLSRRQYGFRPQCGTEDALYDAVQYIREGIRKRKIVAVVSLDIEGAFDSAWWPAILQQLDKKGTDRQTLRLLHSYHGDRSITLEYLGTTVSKSTSKGCIQGSIGGPIFWNVQLDPLMVEADNIEAHVQAYADDILILAQADTGTELEATVNEALAVVERWGKEHKMKFAPQKTQAMICTKKLKYDQPNFYLNGSRISISNRLKLLGLTLDSGLNFRPHLEEITKKTASIFKMVARAARAQWGLNASILRTIYIGVVEPVVTYAASSWAQVADKVYARKKLNSVTRMFAIKISKAHRTTSLSAAAVIARVIPLDMRAIEYLKIYEIKRGKPLDELPGRTLERRAHPSELPHPALRPMLGFRHIDTPEDLSKVGNDFLRLYTDGSKIEGKVGAAVSCWERDKEVAKLALKLGSHCSVFQAEMVAIRRAIKYADDRKLSVNIISDSRSSLESIADPKTLNGIAIGIQRSIAAAKLQGRSIHLFWVKAHVGVPGNERADDLAKKAALHRKTSPVYDDFPLSFAKHSIREATLTRWQERFIADTHHDRGIRLFFEDVKLAYKVLERMGPPNNLRAQLLTGHGGLREYLYRFKLTSAPACVCDDEAVETVRHVLLDCPRFTRARFDCEQRLGRSLDDFRYLIGDDDCRPIFLAFADNIMYRTAKANGSTLP